MYQGKRLLKKECPRFRWHREKAAALLPAVLIVLALAVGTTAAFLVTQDGPIVNEFTHAKVSCRVDEDPFDGTAKTNVAIANTGNTAAYIRAAIVVTWKDAYGGAVYAGKPVAGTDYSIDLNETDWFLGSDGFYYYKNPVASGGSTAVLINSCSAVPENTPEGYGLNVEILGSAIQSVPASTVVDRWNVTVANDGTISK